MSEDPEGPNEERADGPDSFERLDADLGERTPAAEELFEEMDLDDLEGSESADESDWERLISREAPRFGALGRDLPDSVSNEAVVDKGRYCADCEFFSAPPVVACEYPEGTIEEVVDMDRFRVRNCPVVERRRESEEFTAPGASTDD